MHEHRWTIITSPTSLVGAASSYCTSSRLASQEFVWVPSNLVHDAWNLWIRSEAISPRCVLVFSLWSYPCRTFGLLIRDHNLLVRKSGIKVWHTNEADLDNIASGSTVRKHLNSLTPAKMNRQASVNYERSILRLTNSILSVPDLRCSCQHC